MRRAALVATAWVAAATAATALTWGGVSVIGARVTDTRPLPVGPAELGGAPPTTAPAPVGGTVAAPSPTTTATTVPPGPAATVPVTRPAPSAPATGGPAATAPPVATAPSTTASAVTRTYGLVGGSAAVRFSPSGATLLWATPNDGFTVEVEPEGNGIKVEFESPGHRSRLDAWWDGGPRDRIREEPHDGDD